LSKLTAVQLQVLQIIRMLVFVFSAICKQHMMSAVHQITGE
jgi:hypothetical protein